MRHALQVSFVVALALICGAGTASAQEPPGSAVAPPRLSLTDGPVSFWRPGADDWGTAAVNTPLAAGDSLYTAGGGNMELQIGPRAFVRAGENTQLQLTALDADYLQLRMNAGEASLDLRDLPSGQTVEFDTPQGAFTIQQVGYYRFSVENGSSALITRRGATATVTLADGQNSLVSASEEVIVQGDPATAALYAAPEMDAWDQWNYSRTEYMVDALSARYVPAGVYGVADLDRSGAWRTVPDYGPVWIPSGVAAGWSPYSAGHWIYDPLFGWSWVDNAPWGWVPFHYGRWVSVSGYWAWAPGPIVARPVYAPALVAWLGGTGPGIGAGVAWVPLGWGEPCVPWWGSREFVGHPRWDGWGGPRMINHTVVTNVTNISITNITYVNSHVNNAVVAISAESLSRGGRGYQHVAPSQLGEWRPSEHGIDVRPSAASLVANPGRGVRPPAELMARPVVANREPHEPLAALHAAGIEPSGRPGVGPAGPTVVPHAPSGGGAVAAVHPLQPDRGRPGQVVERQAPEAPAAYNTWRAQQGGQGGQGGFRPQPGPAAGPPAGRPGGPAGEGGHLAQHPVNQGPAVVQQRALPGEPAMQMRARPQPAPSFSAPHPGGGGPAPSHPGGGGEGRPPSGGGHPAGGQPAREHEHH
jgi:hypothetical protein